MIVNDVAGFIGPEVFTAPDQLERACLEDATMAKLHGIFRMPSRIGHVAHAFAFCQSDRHLRLRRRQFQGRGHQVGIDALLAPARQSAPARPRAARRGPGEGRPPA